MIIGVGCWRGTGATTTAYALAAAMAASGKRPWLVEADPAGGVLAGRVAGMGARADAGGLERIAFPSPAGNGRVSAIERFTDAAVDVAGIRIVAAPGDAFRSWACHAPRQPWSSSLRELDGPVVIDLGRLRGGTPAGALLGQLHQVLLVSDADPVSIVSSVEWAAGLGRAAPTDSGLALDITRVVVVDAPTAHERSSSVDVEAELGDRLAGWLPWAPDAVRHLSGGVGFDDRRLRKQPFCHAVSHLADRLDRWVHGEAAA